MSGGLSPPLAPPLVKVLRVRVLKVMILRVNQGERTVGNRNE